MKTSRYTRQTQELRPAFRQMARDAETFLASAGNYVEYVMSTGERHLIRTTLQAEAAHLSRLGIARVHRTRLVNLKRIVAVT